MENSTFEEVQARHRRELKDLQGRITSKKKNASKKTRKGVNDECAAMERDLKDKQAAELAALSADGVPEVPAEDVVSVNGVGDTFLGALVAGMAKKGRDARVEEFVDLAQRAAVLTLKSRESVCSGLGVLGMLM